MSDRPPSYFLRGHGLLRGRKVGLYGGSFNPAHQGHAQVAGQALRWLGLDEIWWLTAPHNPLKAAAELADFEHRMASARKVARHPRFLVSDVEAKLGLFATDDLVEALQRRHPNTRFVLVVGADNWALFHRWRRWRSLARRLPIAVIDRPGYAYQAAASVAARALAGDRLAMRGAKRLATRRPPAWTFIRGRLNPMAASLLRAAMQPRDHDPVR